MSAGYKVKAATLQGKRMGQHSARLLVSVGQEYHEGEKLQATVEWIAGRFDNSEVLIGDSLQRFNLMVTGTPESDARAQCRAMGDSWISRNDKALSALPSLLITRWDDWLADPDFPGDLRAIEDAARLSRQFQTAVDDKSAGFWKAKAQDMGWSEAHFGSFAIHAKAYAREEAAVILNLARRPAANLYPGRLSDVWQTLEDTGLIAPGFSLTRLNFSRRKPRQHAPAA